MKKFTRLCAALVVSFGPLVGTITEVNARPSNLGPNVIELDEVALDLITAGALLSNQQAIDKVWRFYNGAKPADRQRWGSKFKLVSVAMGSKSPSAVIVLKQQKVGSTTWNPTFSNDLLRHMRKQDENYRVDWVKH